MNKSEHLAQERTEESKIYGKKRNNILYSSTSVYIKRKQMNDTTNVNK